MWAVKMSLIQVKWEPATWTWLTTQPHSKPQEHGEEREGRPRVNVDANQEHHCRQSRWTRTRPQVASTYCNDATATGRERFTVSSTYSYLELI